MVNEGLEITATSINSMFVLRAEEKLLIARSNARQMHAADGRSIFAVWRDVYSSDCCL